VVIVEQLARRVQSGDQQAIAEIWAMFGDDLRRRARTRLRQMGIASKAESMDVCNAVLLDLIGQNGITLRQPADLLAYVRRAVDNQVRDLLRELSRQRRDFRRTDERPVEMLGVVQPGSSPSRVMLRTELQQKISSQLGSNGEQFLEMYMRRHSWQEIGDAFEITADSARMKWNRCLMQVRRDFGQSGD
jgi:DNA-directed RNA polymerase specialized sigma24 family protein